MTKKILPSGWKIEVREDEEKSWLILEAPYGDAAAFSADRGTIRAQVLQELSITLLNGNYNEIL